MRNINNVGPAFPVALKQGGIYQANSRLNGMTLRDYFAAKALGALVEMSYRVDDLTDKEGNPVTENSIASQAYYFADAMIKAREP